MVTGEADVLAFRTTLAAAGGKELKRSVSVFNGLQDVVPHAVMGMQYALGVCEAAPPGDAMRPMIRHLLASDAPVVIWGAPNVVRHEGNIVERDYPTLKRLYVTWFILPAQGSKLPIEAGKAACERLLCFVSPAFQPVQKV